MKISVTVGLLLFCILCRPSICETIDNNEQDYGEDYEDEDYDYSQYDLLNERHNNTAVITTTTTTTQASTTKSSAFDTNSIPEVFDDLPSIIYKCPDSCQCNYDFRIINCSMHGIEYVPYDLPDVVEKLDLSRNKLLELGERDFQNYTNLKQLILDDNKLENVNFGESSALARLEYLSIANNHLTKIDPNAFSNLIALKTLNLSNNPIVISLKNFPADKEVTEVEPQSFLNQPKLRELFLNGCKLHGIHSNMLRNTSELLVLDLGNNEFDEPIDTQAFAPLRSLVKLKLPELEQNVITQLCKTLTAIDIISLPTFDVSCFELESGSPFDDSTIRTSSTNNNNVNQDDSQNNSGNNKNDIKGVVKSSASRNEATGRRVDKNGGKSIERNEPENSTRRNLPSAMESAHMNRSHAESVNSTTASTNQQTADADDDENYKVAISSQLINQILIGIIIVAVAGIIIGIICRRDLCGIKTKMCRTRRPAPTDQVRPAEEIPLNKV